MSQARASRTDPDKLPRTVFRTATVLTFLTIVMGGLVCANQAGASCPMWPWCYSGRPIPQARLDPIIEFTHRVVAISAGVLLLWAAVVGRRSTRGGALVRVIPWIALGCAAASATFGMLAVLYGIPLWVGALDLGCSLTAMALMSLATFAVERPRVPWTVTRGSIVGWVAVGAVILLHVTGILVAVNGYFTRCIGWPVWRIISADAAPTWQELRMGWSFIAGLLVVTCAVAAWGSRSLKPHGALLGVLCILELAFVLWLREEGLSKVAGSLTSTAAACLLWCLALLSARRSLPTPTERGLF